KSLSVLFFIIVLAGCKSTKQATPVKNLPEITVTASPNKKVYHASNTMSSDLVHTKLVVKFDWGKKYLYGQATITLKPHFYPVDSVILNARGMDISKVMQGNREARFHYENDSLKIFLDRKYSRDENYTVWIDYTSKPDELPEGGSIAIKKDKGLYF